MLFGKLPQAWKDAVVTAIPKNANVYMVSSLKPVCISPTPFKFWKKILRDNISAWFTELKVTPEQHCFCMGASTNTHFVDCIRLDHRPDKKNSVDVTYLDLSKAFDKVSHVKLLSKIERIGISSQILMWLKGYLSERHIDVKKENGYSKGFNCHSRVPQGGVLSP